MKKFTALIVIAIVGIFMVMAGCSSDASRANKNLTTAADNFEINRRVIFYNGITDKYILSIEGRCSVEFHSNKFTVVIKTGPNEFKRHYLGKADNVFPFVEQLEPAKVDVYSYRVIFKPETIIPNIDFKSSLTD